MKKSLRPAFIVTFASLVAACERRPPAPDPNSKPATGNPPEPTIAAPPPESTAPGLAPKRRAVRSPLPSPEYMKGPLDWAKTTRLNPSDPKGRVIYASADGSCYVRVPPPAGTPIGPPGSDQSKHESVDCSESMQDPAWDTCLDEEMRALPTGSCFCAHTGNPPPPPSVAECPKAKQ